MSFTKHQRVDHSTWDSMITDYDLRLIKELVMEGLYHEYDIKPSIISLYKKKNDFSYNNTLCLEVVVNGFRMCKNLDISNNELVLIMDKNILIKDITMNFIHSFHELKDLKAIGNDKQKAILNMRHNSKLVRDYCAKVLYEEKKNEVSKNA